jgi:hypothetical protein
MPQITHSTRIFLILQCFATKMFSVVKTSVGTAGRRKTFSTGVHSTRTQVLVTKPYITFWHNLERTARTAASWGDAVVTSSCRFPTFRRKVSPSSTVVQAQNSRRRVQLGHQKLLTVWRHVRSQQTGNLENCLSTFVQRTFGHPVCNCELKSLNCLGSI